MFKSKTDLIELRFFLGILTLAQQSEKSFFFSDEKLFTIKDYVNSQSYKVYAKSSAVVDEFVRTVYRRQKQFLLGLQSPNLGSQL